MSLTPEYGIVYVCNMCSHVCCFVSSRTCHPNMVIFSSELGWGDVLNSYTLLTAFGWRYRLKWCSTGVCKGQRPFACSVRSCAAVTGDITWLQSVWLLHTHTHTHARTHARMHARTHTHTGTCSTCIQIHHETGTRMQFATLVTKNLRYACCKEARSYIWSPVCAAHVYYLEHRNTV